MKLFFLLVYSCFFALSANAQRKFPKIIQKDGKYGLADEFGVVGVPLIYDSIYSAFKDYEKWPVKQFNPVFIIKQKTEKLGFAYCINMDSMLTKNITNQWYISEIKYDTIYYISSYYDQAYNAKRYSEAPFSILAYKLDGKWGLIYIPTDISKFDDNTLDYAEVPAKLGYFRMTEPIFEKIILEEKFRSHDPLDQVHGFHNVKIDGKWRIVQVVIEHPYRADYEANPSHQYEFRVHLYDAAWDHIPEKKIRNKSEREYCFKVVKDSLFGVMCYDIVTQQEELVFPYVAINPKNIDIDSDGIQYYQREQKNYLFHDGETLHRIPVQKPYNSVGWPFTYQHFDGSGKRQFIPFYYSYESIDIGSNWAIKIIALYEKGKLIHEFNEPNFAYVMHHYEYGLLIEKRYIQGKNYVHEYYDFETEKVVFRISYRKSSTPNGNPKKIEHNLKNAWDDFEKFTYYDKHRKYSKTYILGYYNSVRKEFVKKLPK